MSDSKPPVNTGGRKRAYSSFTISRDVREKLHASLYLDGDPVEYFKWLKYKKPEAYVSLIKGLIRQDDESSVGGLSITVVQLTAEPQPVPGVLNSPVRGHIAPQRHLQLVTEVKGDE